MPNRPKPFSPSYPNDFKVFLAIRAEAAAIHGNSFTYTLLHEHDF